MTTAGPEERVRAKVMACMDEWVREFVARSPFAVLATSNPAGNCDASPRGGEPGFVRVVDEHRLLVPDRPGNRLFQSFGNVEANPHVGLLFVVPGMEETARVNGRARVVPRDSPEWVALTAGWGDAASYQAVLVVDVEESYYHCGRAVRNADLWNARVIAAHRAAPPLPKRPAGMARWREQAGD